MGLLLNKSAEDKQYKSGLNGLAGLTKLVELMPLKKDSMSALLEDIVFQGI
jgi:hypothetical protein